MPIFCGHKPVLLGSFQLTSSTGESRKSNFQGCFFFNSLFFHCYTRVCVMVLNITFFGGSEVKVNFCLNLLRVHRLYIFPQVAF